MIDVDEGGGEEGSNELLVGGRGGQAPGGDPQDRVQEAEEMSVRLFQSTLH